MDCSDGNTFTILFDILKCPLPVLPFHVKIILDYTLLLNLVCQIETSV